MLYNIKLNEMKTLTTIILTFACIFAYSQNVMVYTDRVYDDSIRIDTFTCNISQLKTDGKITAGLANNLITYGKLQIGTIYVGINENKNKTCGNYRRTIGDGVILRKKGGELVICDPYTVCEATDEEIIKYY